MHVPRKLARAVVVACEVAALACGAAPSSPSREAISPPPAAPLNADALNRGLLVCPAAAAIASLDPIRIEFDAATRGGALVCRASEGSVDLTTFQRYAYRALLFLKETRFDAPLPWTQATRGNGSSGSIQRCISFPAGRAPATARTASEAPPN
jgi:hypothetical protein